MLFTCASAVKREARHRSYTAGVEIPKGVDGARKAVKLLIHALKCRLGFGPR